MLGGSGAHPASDSAWDREPLATLREERRLFRRWVPLSLIVGLLLGLALLRFGLQVALIGMLLVQTGGFFATFVMAQRHRTDPMRQPPRARTDDRAGDRADDPTDDPTDG